MKFKRHISLVLPSFRRNKIVSNLDLIVDCTDKLLTKWRKKDDGDSQINAGGHSMRLAIIPKHIRVFIGFDWFILSYLQ